MAVVLDLDSSAPAKIAIQTVRSRGGRLRPNRTLAKLLELTRSATYTLDVIAQAEAEPL